MFPARAGSSTWCFVCSLELPGAGNSKPLIMNSSQRVGCTSAHLLCLVCLCSLPCHGYCLLCIHGTGAIPLQVGAAFHVSVSWCLLGAFLFLLEELDAPCSGVLQAVAWWISGGEVPEGDVSEAALAQGISTSVLQLFPHTSPLRVGLLSFLAPIPVQGRQREDQLFPLPGHN